MYLTFTLNHADVTNIFSSQKNSTTIDRLNEVQIIQLSYVLHYT